MTHRNLGGNLEGKLVGDLIDSAASFIGISTLCKDNFRNNRWLKESGIIDNFQE